MFLSLCSSAAVQGVFVRLFFAGGCIDAEEEDSPCPSMADDGPATARRGLAAECPTGPDVRRFRALGGEIESGLRELSAVDEDCEAGC